MFADEGDTVGQGEVLAELDKKDAEAQVRQSRVQVNQRRIEFERAKELLGSGLIPRAEYDNARFAYENAQESLNINQLQLDNLTIQAPIGGVITKRNIQKGMLVSSGAPVFELVDPGSYLININPSEKELPRLHVGQVAKFTVDALEGEEFEAKVTRVNPSVDEHGTVKVRLEMDAEIRSKLRESAFVRVQLVMATREDALLVPKDAIEEEYGRKFLFVVEEKAAEEKAEEGEQDQDAAAEGEEEAEDEQVEEESSSDETTEDVPNDGGESEPAEPRLVAARVEVEVGLQDSDRAEILSGIDDDALVITLGQKNLKPGTEVRITTTEEEVAAFEGVTPEEALEAAKAKHEALEKRAEREKREAQRRAREQRTKSAAGEESETESKDTDEEGKEE